MCWSRPVFPHSPPETNRVHAARSLCVEGVQFVIKEHNEINLPLGIVEATSLDLLTKGSDSER